MPRPTPENPASIYGANEAINDSTLPPTRKEMGYPSADCEEVMDLLNSTAEIDPTSSEVTKALERCREGLRR